MSIFLFCKKNVHFFLSCLSFTKKCAINHSMFGYGVRFLLHKTALKQQSNNLSVLIIYYNGFPNNLFAVHTISRIFIVSFIIVGSPETGHKYITGTRPDVKNLPNSGSSAVFI